MGRASYREVAARLDIEPVEALSMLREQRDQGLCDFSDGGWFICTATEQAKKPAAPVHQAPRLKGKSQHRLILNVFAGCCAITAQ